MPVKKILITGAYGLLGGDLWEHFSKLDQEYDVYALDMARTASRSSPKDRTVIIPDEKFRLADISSYDAVMDAVKGMDIVVHCAAIPRPTAAWEGILNCNVIGTYNVFEACSLAKVKRVVFSSSIRVTMGYYEYDEPYKSIHDFRFADVPEKIPPVSHESAPRPLEPYGVSKLWGEGLARMHADRGEMSCLCIRFGGIYGTGRPSREGQGIWCSRRDATQIVQKCVGAPDSLRFGIYYAVSESRHRWVDIEHARNEIGFVPQDREAEI